MTLILTALCKNGVCVCADKRYKIGGSGEPIRFEDNHKKIYKFKTIPLIIFNHGVNRFGNKFWEQFCTDYEQSNQWVGKDLIQIADSFKDFMENVVKDELAKNREGANGTGFVLCGKTTQDNKFKIKELFWKLESNEIHFTPRRHKHNLVGSGVAYEKYLDGLIRGNETLNKDYYWGKMKTDMAEKELGKLFSIAVKEKERLRGDEFSDNFDIECISD